MTRRLPYDRVNTSMADFALCPACQAEYTDPGSRRFHAEPVACHDCGPRLSLDIHALADALAASGIVAIKGLGGYHLACNARDNEAVERLRAGKLRDGKPLAVMVLNTASAAQYVQLDPVGTELLLSPEATGGGAARRQRRQRAEPGPVAGPCHPRPDAALHRCSLPAVPRPAGQSGGSALAG